MPRKISIAPPGDVPFLSEQTIEAEAKLLLDEFALANATPISAPVPIEDIIELHLKLAFEFRDLRSEFQSNDVLGAIWFDSQVIAVDNHLDPTKDPQLMGRYRFTLAHETAHWRLHRKHYQQDPDQKDLFGGRGQPAYVCRSSDKPSAEWQADSFAGSVLVPRDLLREKWNEWRGNLDTVALQQLAPANVSHDPKRNENATLEMFCRPLADAFEVSAEAMRIRLEQMGFLRRSTEPMLF